MPAAPILCTHLFCRSLKKRQRPDGSWGPTIPSGVTYEGRGEGYNFPAGPTALSLLTLLKCGVAKDAPAIVRGFAFMERAGSHHELREISALVLASARRRCGTGRLPSR